MTRHHFRASTNRTAERELIEELRRFARGEGNDEQPVSALDPEAIDSERLPSRSPRFDAWIDHREPRSTIVTSVCTKSSPLKRSGSPVEIASAYEKQSP